MREVEETPATAAETPPMQTVTIRIENDTDTTVELEGDAATVLRSVLIADLSEAHERLVQTFDSLGYFNTVTARDELERLTTELSTCSHLVSALWYLAPDRPVELEEHPTN